MKIIWLIIYLAPLTLFGQLGSDKNSGIGIGIGNKTPVGVFGAFYSQRTMIGTNAMEFKLGIGLHAGLVLNSGLGVRVFGNNKKIELFGCLDFSHHFSGELDYDYGVNNVRDVYTISQYNYIQPNLLFRGIVAHTLALQIRSGYSFSLKEGTFTHKFGPNQSSDWIEKKIGSGYMLEIGIVVFF